MAAIESLKSYALFVALFIVGYSLFWPKRRLRLPYPPGPKGWPIIGNVFDVPEKTQWLTYTEWANLYGDLVHLNLLGQHLIVINSKEVAEELFGRRANVYSDRPVITVMTMNGWDVNMGLKKYGNDWRADRRALHQHLRRDSAVKMHPVEESKAAALLHAMLKDPNRRHDHFGFYPASVMMRSAYGHNAVEGDAFVDLTFSIVGLFSSAVFPGSNLLNLCPPLKHLPPWFPIPSLRELHRRCANCRDFLSRAQDAPFQALKDHMAAETAVDSWLHGTLEQNAQGRRVVPEKTAKTMGITTFTAAIETVVSTLSTFVLAMILFPEVQARAHAEIDAVIGDKRLPTFEDRQDLPYIEALMQEVLRWHPPPPLGIPHATSSDDVYENFLIPKDSVIIYNLWAMCRDEATYAQADQFKPERFLARDGVSPEPHPPVYGFGRRICVGRWAADELTWMAIVSMISVFRFQKAKDQSGNDIEVKEDYTDGIVSSPLPFECSITPRSEVHRQLILDNPPPELSSNPLDFEFDKSKYV